MEKLNLFRESANSFIYLDGNDNGRSQTVVKVAKPNEEGVQQTAYLKREFELTRNLELRGVRRALEETTYEGDYAIRLEFIQGLSLKEYLEARPFDLSGLLKIAIKLTQILGEIHHHGIIHHDINSYNILIDPSGEHVHLIDFGLARRWGNSDDMEMATGNQLGWNFGEGTLAYLSPEQSGRVQHQTDNRSDLYSWGVTLYEMFTKELPFNASDPAGLVHAHLAKKPASPNEINPKVPIPIAQIIEKLLAKNPAYRYQSASGLEADLVKCWEQYAQDGKITNFKLSQYDDKPALQIPDKLYGREQEYQILVDAFESSLKGKRNWVSITGEIGVGKSRLGARLKEEVSKAGGYFIEGKFDAKYRQTPYYAWMEAFESFLDHILIAHSSKLEQWKSTLQKALGQNAKLLTDVLPKLELIIGKQETLPIVGPQKAIQRFNYVLHAFINSISAADFPLIIQLDDWHYADSASVELLQLLLTQDSSNYFLVICTYREQDLNAFTQKSFEQLKNELEKSYYIRLENYTESVVENMLRDVLGEESVQCHELAGLLFEKTNGNPFFTIQMLKSLVEERLLTYSVEKNAWTCDLDKISQLNISDNVVDLLEVRFKKLAPGDQEMLQVAACFGDDFSVDGLAQLEHSSTKEVLRHIAQAIQDRLILPYGNEDQYRFAHSRIRKIIYRLLPLNKRAQVHGRIGKQMLLNIPEEVETFSSEKLFELLHHLKEGKEFIELDPRQYASLNLMASQRSIRTGAYPEAEAYVDTAVELLPPNSWDAEGNMALSVLKQKANIAFLNGNVSETINLLQKALKRQTSYLETISLLDQLLMVETSNGAYTQAFRHGKLALSKLGFDLKYRDAERLLQFKSQEIQTLHADLDIESISKLPQANSPNISSAIRILTHMEPAASLGYSQEVWALTVLKAAHLTFKYGLTTESPFAFVGYAQILAHLQGDLELGYDLGIEALRLSRKQGDPVQICRVSAQFGGRIYHWRKHLRHVHGIFDHGFKKGVASGEMVFAAHILMYKLSSSIAQGSSLPELETLIGEAQAFSQKFKNAVVNDTLEAYQRIIDSLQGKSDPDKLGDAHWMERCRDRNSMTSLGIYHFYIALQGYLLGEREKTTAALAASEELHPYMLGMIQLAEWYLIKSLHRLDEIENSSPEEIRICLEEIDGYLVQLKKWAQSCPENFLHKFFLIEAELARVEGRYWDAARRYDAAIVEARNAEFVQYEALANDLAGRFWQTQRKHVFARTYIRQAYACYTTWGATRKAKALKKQYAPYFQGVPQVGSGSSGMVNLDTVAMLKANQALSGEIVLSNLLERMMRILIENAGAERGAFIRHMEGELLVQAIGSIEEGIDLMDNQALETSVGVSQAIIHYVARTQEALVLADAGTDKRVAQDQHIVANEVKSVLCSPIVHKGQLNGVIYLENNLSSEAFTEDRLELISMLSSQIAISLENATLYEQLDAKVKARTKDLNEKNEALSHALDQLQATQVQLVDSAKMASLGQLTAGIAHEINNPINFVAANVQPLQRDFNDIKSLLTQIGEMDSAEDAKAAIHKLVETTEELDVEFLMEEIEMLLEGIQEGAKRTSEIVKGLKSFSRLEEDSFKLADVHEGIDATLMLLSTKTKEKVNISKEFGDLPAIECMPGKLNQVFMNILSNSIDAVDEKGKSSLEDEVSLKPEEAEIKIKTWHDAEHVFISIADNGMGMDEKIQARIFEPFFTTKEIGTGTGLGLSISKGIIDRHNGTIEVNSSPGSGCEFVIKLPK